jgi:UDP-N-acetyl-2-amino-2-deoxyglucuronate dehydrogenase
MKKFNRKYNFCLIGVAGYIAKKHLFSIKKLKQKLLLSYDPNDSVGLLDSFFPNSLFFCKFSLFKKNYYKLRKKIDYTIIATPNYLHFKYIKFALSNGSNVICEKPLVISLRHLKKIQELEKKYKKKVYTIMQLRTLDEVNRLKKKINKKKNYNILIDYVTPRGQWYEQSWKGNVRKSGGILFNIGIHLIDLLTYLFGKHTKVKIIYSERKSIKGLVFFNNARALFNLSINNKKLFKYKKSKSVIRDFFINDKKIDLAKNFDDSHTDCYLKILEKKDNIFTVSNVKKSLELVLDLKKQI